MLFTIPNRRNPNLLKPIKKSFRMEGQRNENWWLNNKNHQLNYSDANYISLLRHIRKTYSSAAKYLSTQCRVSDETLDLLKQKLLE